MKTTIRKIEHIVYRDLSGMPIWHMEEWVIYYESGAKRTIKGKGKTGLSKTQREWLISKKLQNVRTGFYAESATTKTRTYY